MKYSVCIEMIYKELDFYQRIEKVKQAGFSHFEFWIWEGKDLGRIKKICKDTGMNVASFSGDNRFSLTSAREKAQYIEHMI